jgi:hypothetical protein
VKQNLHRDLCGCHAIHLAEALGQGVIQVKPIGWHKSRYQTCGR